MSFLDESYEQPAVGGDYTKLKKGTTRIRILSDAVTGYQDWDKSEKKPKPVITQEKQQSISKDGPKHFWAFIVYNYDDKRIQTCLITQKGIQDKIMTLYKDEEWGDPKGYDLKIARDGDGMDTRYEVTPGKATDVEKEILQEYLDLKPDLRELFRGGNPLEPQPNSDDDNESTPF